MAQLEHPLPNGREVKFHLVVVDGLEKMREVVQTPEGTLGRKPCESQYRSYSLQNEWRGRRLGSEPCGFANREGCERVSPAYGVAHVRLWRDEARNLSN